MAKKEKPNLSSQQKALSWLIGGLGFGMAIGVAIGLTFWEPFEGLALGIALGSGIGGVPASLYYFGEL